jgi:hypothetical protein
MIPGDILTAAGVLFSALAAIGAALWRARIKGLRDGRTSAINEGLRDAARRMESGRQAVQRGRDSGGDVDSRLRGNDSKWR